MYLVLFIVDLLCSKHLLQNFQETFLFYESATLSVNFQMVPFSVGPFNSTLIVWF